MMAESGKLNNSQTEKELLPLSQETFNQLWDMMHSSGREEMLNILNESNSDLPETLHVAHIPHTGSSRPATSNWHGNYNFKLLFEYQENVNKHIAWTFSKIDNKLYVRKDAVCPFSFQTDRVVPDGVLLRAMAVYSSPEHSSRVVTRCVNHSMQELNQGIFEAEHLIRSDSRLAQYEINSDSKRHSVVVPFENPPVGQDYSTYLFSFACFGSCAGGPNRRPLTLVFTLEQGAMLLGRISVDLKICACPGRDRNIAEKERFSQSVSSASAVKKRQSEPISTSLPNFFDNFPKKKKLKGNSEDKKEFLIKVKDEECYMFLLKMKCFFDTYKKVGNLSPECKALLQILRSSSDEEL